MNKTTLKKLKDINHASYLKLKRFKLHLEPEWEGNSAYFVFEDNGKADELIENYINGNAIGNLRDFAVIQRGLKQMLFK